MTPNKWSGRIPVFLWSLAGAAVLILAGLLLTPVAMEWYIEKSLAEAGAVNAEIEDIDFNPFTAVLRIKTLQGFPRQPDEILAVAEAVIDYRWLPLWKHRLYIRHLEMRHGAIEIVRGEDGGLTVGGFRLPAGNGEKGREDRWQIGFGTIKLGNVRISYRDPQIRLPMVVGNAEIAGIESWNPEDSGSFTLQMTVNERPLDFSGRLAPFAGSPSISGRLDLKGFGLAALQPLLVPGEVSISGELTAGTEVEFRMNEGAGGFAVTGDFALDDLSLQGRPSSEKFAVLSVSQRHLQWNGVFHGEYDARAGLRFSGEGKLAGEELELLSENPSYLAAQEAFQAEGKFSLQTVPDKPFQLEGQLQATGKNLRLTDSNRQTLLGIDQYDLQEIDLAGVESISAGKLLFSGTSLLERSPPSSQGKPREPRYIATINRIALQQAVLENLLRLSVQSLDIRDLETWIVRTGEGIFETGPTGNKERAAGAGQSEGTPDAGSVPPGKEPFTLALDSLTLSGDNRLSFRDQSIEPHFSAVLSPVAVTVNDIDTGSPENSSRLSLEGQTGEHGSLRMDGTAQLFSDPLSMDLKVELQEYNLTALTPYIRKNIGYSVDSGLLDVQGTWVVEANQLDAGFDLKLVKARFDKIGEKERAALGASLGLPLNQALNLVRNKQGNIELRLGLSGDLGNPTFHFGDIFWSAVGRALRQASLNYFAAMGVTLLTGANLPVGALWVADKIFSKLTALRFDPFVCEPLQSELTSEQKQRLDRMAKLLKDRPEVQLVVCGIAAPPDLLALRGKETPEEKPGEGGNGTAGGKPMAGESGLPAVPDKDETVKLTELAEQRSQAVKDYLIGAGIESGRLITCRPEYHAAAEADPGIEVGI